MRKLIMMFGRVPASIRKISGKVLKATTRILELLESKAALEIAAIIPGEQDEAFRVALIAALTAFNDAMQQANSRSERKRIAKQIAVKMLTTIDGNKLSEKEYDVLFEKVFLEGKA